MVSRTKSITQFMGDMYQNVNVYENFLTLFGKNFVSPVADGGSQHYDYLLVDSNWVDHAWCYQIRFSGRRNASYKEFKIDQPRRRPFTMELAK
ncbi:MAG: hypothetical protein IPP33_05975 [Flavobacteriales bacterium]|nr:hypothetical protein [Flavobacteriales bacterium]